MNKIFEKIVKIKYDYFLENKEYGVKFLIYSQSKKELNYLNDYLTERIENFEEVIKLYYVENEKIFNDISKKLENKKYEIIQTFFNKIHYKYRVRIDNKVFIEIYKSEKNDYFIINWNKNIIICNKIQKNNHLLIYIYREIVYRYFENNNYIMLHGACFENNKKGYIICGKSGSGKSTFLISALENSNYFISNDRVLISKNLVINSFPMPLRIGLGTVYNNDKLKKFIINNFDFLKRDNIFSKEDILIEKISIKEKIEITIKEIESCYHKIGNNFIKLEAIIIPEFDKNRKEEEIELISKEDIVEYLLNEKYTPNDPLWTNDWIYKRNLDINQLSFLSEKILREIISKVNIFRIKFGPKLNKNFDQLITKLDKYN